MDKVKIQEIADEAGLSNNDLLNKALELGFNVKSAYSVINMEEAGVLVDYAISGTLPKDLQERLSSEKYSNLDEVKIQEIADIAELSNNEQINNMEQSLIISFKFSVFELEIEHKILKELGEFTLFCMKAISNDMKVKDISNIIQIKKKIIKKQLAFAISRKYLTSDFILTEKGIETVNLFGFINIFLTFAPKPKHFLSDILQHSDNTH